MERTLVVLHGSVPLAAVQSLISEQGISADQADVTTDPSSSTGTSGYARAVCVGSKADAVLLGAVAKLLKPGAKALLQLHGGSEADASSALLLSGFADCQASTSGGVTTVSAHLPDFAVGSKDSIKLKPKPAAQAAAADASSSKKAWLLAGDDFDDDDGGELLDDDELLTEEDRQRPAAAKQDDCELGPGGARKACKNCSCGRAEAEAAGVKVALTQDMLDNPQSACGNCSLGDAFRCAGCPYRGLPAFEAGKKIQLTSDFLTADA
ncbi:cytokine-induced anti-apoptosis inhibitor 1, Fe-S biogenesis-domain-containing protein [Scenedesmus sp. NREL 46B-D3]|nr:cytokine-induced anti-apoptosis inhibitor 1, Fe-S biogenesis-domain-containing protein [Scenedesmus sp. NREL 46B-D3]